MITLFDTLALIAIVGGATLALCGIMGLLLMIGGAILEGRHGR